MGDFGGKNDGICEFSFFTRCDQPATMRVTFGQQSTWTYRYCTKHGAEALKTQESARMV